MILITVTFFAKILRPCTVSYAVERKCKRITNPCGTHDVEELENFRSSVFFMDRIEKKPISNSLCTSQSVVRLFSMKLTRALQLSTDSFHSGVDSKEL